jgi:AbrB family looped-hinge helix DNA binding protein
MKRFDKDRPDFFGITTVGERGQIVVPKDAREALHLEAGDKLVVMPNPRGNGILLMREEAIRELAQRMNERADFVHERSKQLEEKLRTAESAE